VSDKGRRVVEGGGWLDVENAVINWGGRGTQENEDGEGDGEAGMVIQYKDS
jgi:hypothetical protein